MKEKNIFNKNATMKAIFNFFENLPADQKKITFSTKLTILRIILVPFIIFFLIKRYWFLSFCLVFISAISDLFDGIIARIRNECTLLGACLDPIADKLFILSCYFIISLGYFPRTSIPIWFAWLVFIKEALLIIGAIFCFSKIKNEIKPIWLGKIAMDVQTFFILWLFVSYFFNWHFEIFNKIIMFAIVILVLSSFVQYVRMYKSMLFKDLLVSK